MYLAVFAHPASWPREKGVSPTTFKATYRIFDPRTDCYVSSFSGPKRSHIGISPNQIHLLAYQHALMDPILDRYNHTKLVIFCPHNLIAQTIDRAIRGQRPEPSRFAEKFSIHVLPYIDNKSHAPIWTEKNIHLNNVLGPLLRFDYAEASTPDYLPVRAPLTVIGTIQDFAQRALKTYEDIHEFNKRQDTLF